MSLTANQMLVGIIHFMAFPATMRGEGPVLDTLRTLVDDAYFDFLEVTHIASDSVRREAAAMLRASGKRYAFGAQPCLLTRKANLNAADPARRREAVDILKAAINEAVEIGAEAFAFLSGQDPGANERAQGYALLAESVREVCGYARRQNPALCVTLETFDRVAFGKNALVGPTSEAVAFADAIRKDFPDFGLLLDLSHLPLLGESSAQALTTANAYLNHIHIGNCVMRDSAHVAYGDEHPSFGIPEGENGVAELTDFVRVLQQIGYFAPARPGTVSFEVKPMPGQSSQEVIDQAKATLNIAREQLDWSPALR